MTTEGIEENLLTKHPLVETTSIITGGLPILKKTNTQFVADLIEMRAKQKTKSYSKDQFVHSTGGGKQKDSTLVGIEV